MTQTIQVNPASLLVSAVNQSITYGSAIPAFTYAIAGFVNGDTQVSATTGAPAFSTTAKTSSPAGTYPITITAGTLAAANYSFRFANGTLSVIKATPTITWPAPAPVVYGSASSAVQLDASSTVKGSFTYSPALRSLPKVGTATLSTTFTPSDSVDYTAVSDTVNLVVSQATPKIAWTAPAAIRYGTKLSATQLNATSSTPGTFSYSPATGTVLGAGSHTLTAAFAPKDASDYTTATAAVTVVVKPAPLTVTANNATRAYGAPNSSFAAAYAGFVNGDTAITALADSPSLTTTATANSPPGTYTITAEPGSLAAANYTFKLAAGIRTVTKAALTVAATSASVAHNQAIPKLVYNVTGFVNSDTSSILKGAPFESTTAKQGSNYGIYPITMTQGTLAANNDYSFQFVNGTLTVTPLGAAAAPTFSPAAETSTTTVNIVIAESTTGATIYYTTNGSTPTTTSTRYTTAVKVSATETLQAIAAAPGYTPSALASAAYIVATAPAATSSAATAINTPIATLKGAVNPNNATTQYWFAYGTSKAALITTTMKTSGLTGATATPVRATISGLKTKTTYYFQLVASNAVGTTSGTLLSFTTN